MSIIYYKGITFEYAGSSTSKTSSRQTHFEW